MTEGVVGPILDMNNLVISWSRIYYRRQTGYPRKRENHSGALKRKSSLEEQSPGE